MNFNRSFDYKEKCKCKVFFFILREKNARSFYILREKKHHLIKSLRRVFESVDPEIVSRGSGAQLFELVRVDCLGHIFGNFYKFNVI